MSFEFGQDVILAELMLYAPMNILEQMAENQKESILADMQGEDAESVSVHNGRKLSRKSRRAVRIERNKQKKGSDRAHGKRHGRKYLDNLSRKKFLEADNYDHFTFKVINGKLTPIKDVKTARVQFATM